MCFTINIHTTRDAIEKRFEADASVLNDFDFRYFYRAFENPLLPVITGEEPGVVQLMQWGLIPHWVRDIEQAEKIRKGTYNARAETLDAKPSFRSAYGKNHCVIITCGFFEWQHLGNQKIPWYISSKNNPFMTLAGIYDEWGSGGDRKAFRSFSIVTVPANPLMEKIHNTKKRMPAILDRLNERNWMETSERSEYGRVHTPYEELLTPYEEEQLSAYTVSKSITSPGTDPHEKAVIEPVHYHIDQRLF
jgi:putative SOS response-associated peptidase YedK